MLETINYLNNLLIDGNTIVLGLSGGSDSMCLLDILLKLNKKITIVVAHINHNIREESNNEAKFLKNYCSSLNVIFETTKFNKKSQNKDYNESELRELRYEYFEKIIDKYQAQYLLTAHHGDDLIETILMRITRGSDLKGYAGFDLITKKNKYSIIKPLIFSNKEEIEKYNKKNNIPSLEDITNSSSKYTRNRYRKNIVPFLKKENPNIHLKYLKFSQELEKYQNYIMSIVEKEMAKRYKDNTLDLDGITELDQLIKENIIKRILDINYPKNLYLVNDNHTKFILKMINNNTSNSSLDLPDNLIVKKRYNKLLFTREKKELTDYYLEIEKHTILPNKKHIDILEKSEETNNNCTRLNSKELALPLYVRNRKNGDKMVIKNFTGTKKIKDIYIDNKIDLEKRDTEPVVVDSNDTILWLPGIKKSKFDKEKTEEYDIILWYN